MDKRSLDEMDTRMGPAAVSNPLTDALGLTDFALNYYELDPGDSFAYGFHAHEQQEEVFYVQSGVVTFETVDEDVEVAAGEVVRFGPGEFQRGVNRGDERVRALAMGAPQDSGETEILVECPDCGGRTPQDIRLTDDREHVITVCEECGAETARHD